jgi:DNA repair exonuclease SbcCD ATPase subunit
MGILREGYDEMRHRELKGRLEELRSERDRVEGEISRLESELDKAHKRIERLKEEVKEYEQYSRMTELYEDSIALVERLREVIRDVAVGLRDRVREEICARSLKMLHKLGFEDIEEIRIDERFTINAIKQGIIFGLMALDEGARNVIGAAIKLATALASYGPPPLLCFDGCLHLDPGRLKALLEHLRGLEVGITLVTERVETGPMRVIHMAIGN